MNTKTIVIGETEIQKTPPNPIRFVHYLEMNLLNEEPLVVKKCDGGFQSPRDYKFIELISLNYTSSWDLMFAYDNPKNRSSGILYIGKWNDGVVG